MSNPLRFFEAPRKACCGATNAHCTEARPRMTLTGCDTCGHSLACHADPLPVLHGNQRRAIGTVDLGSVSVPLYEVLDGTVTIG